jgi:rod shape-determining protein MreD
VRKLLVAVPLLVIALLLQLTVLNGLQLPGGGVPDLVLVLVAAIALSSGPVPGMIIGFAAGLAIDLAPPGSPVIGLYALVFCLLGWACGRLRGLAARSAVQSVALLAVAIAVAECLAAALGHAVAPAQVTLSQIRHVLPYSILYDLLICPFVLYPVLLASSWLDHGLVAGQPADGLPPGPARLLERRARKKGQPAPHQPQLRRAAARSSDGWVGSAPHSPASQHLHVPASRPPSAARGVAGSASGYAHHGAGPAAAPVHVRLGSGRRGDARIASAPGAPRLAGHPGQLARRATFRPHGSMPGGSAAASFAAVPVSAGPSRSIRFRNYRGDAGLARSLRPTGNGTALPAAGGRSPRLRLAGSVTPAISPAQPKAVPRLRLRGSLSPAIAAGRRVSTPKLDFRTHQHAPGRRKPAEPRFRGHAGPPRPTALAAGLASGGALDQQAFRAMRRRTATPRLKLASGRNAAGMLGGTGTGATRVHGSAAVPRFRTHPAVRRSSGFARKSPRFGYGRRSLLSFLVGKRIGGRWLASRRVGSRSAVWMISRRPGGSE